MCYQSVHRFEHVCAFCAMCYGVSDDAVGNEESAGYVYDRHNMMCGGNDPESARRLSLKRFVLIFVTARANYSNEIFSHYVCFSL